MSAADPITGLRLLVDTGLAEYFLPELPGLRLAIDEHAQHKDVYEHTLTVIRNAVDLERDGPDFVLRMAALMHDIGKPATKAVGPDGRVSFHHHEVVGARLTRQRMRTMRFPKDVITEVSELVALHLRFYGYGRGEWTDSAVRRYVTDAGRAAGPAAQADPLRLHHPQPAQGGPAFRRLRRAGAADRPDRGRGRSGSGASGPRRKRDHGVAGSAAWPAGRSGLALSEGAATRPRPTQPRRGRRRAAAVGRRAGSAPLAGREHVTGVR